MEEGVYFTILFFQPFVQFSMVGVSAALASASLLSTEVICALGTDAPFVV